MRIHNSSLFLFAHRQATRHQSVMARAVQRLSSGYRINSAADDPAGLGISQRMRAQLAGVNQSVRNAENGLSMINITEGTLGSVAGVLQRLVDLGEYAANGTLNPADRHHLQQEAKGLLDSIKTMGGSSNFAAQKLLEIDQTVQLQVGPSNEDYDKLLIQLPALQDALSMLDDFSLETQSLAVQSLDKVKQAVDKVSGLRAGLGAQANRLEHTINNLKNTAENLEESESRIRDVDMAKELMDYTKAQMLSQVAQMAMAHAMDEPKRVLNLLKTAL